MSLCGGHAHLDAVCEDPRARGHRRTVAARLTDDGCAFTGDRGLVDARHARNHLAVGGDQVACLDQHDLIDEQLAGGDPRPGFTDAQHALCVQVGLGRAQRCGLRLAAPFGQRLGEIAEQDGEPQPEDQLRLEGDIAGSGRNPLDQQHRRQGRDEGRHEHHGIADKFRRGELDHRIARGGRHQRPGEERSAFGHVRVFQSRVPAATCAWSAIGPRTRLGRKVRPPTIRMIAVNRPTHRGPVVGKEPDVDGV